MDVGSGPRYPHDPQRSVGEGWTSARIVGTLVIVLALCLLALLVAVIGLIPLAPASEPVLSAPFRWAH